MQLIDTHLHLILRDHLRYAWADAIPALAGRSFSLADYAALTAGLGVAAALFMETGVDEADWRAEARLVAGLVGQGGLLGQIASCRPETDAGFDDWLDECAGLQVCGLRRILHVVDDGMSQTRTFRANLRRIGARGLPFEMCFLARQLPLAEALARACDDQPLVLDHCGVPDIAAGAFVPWAEAMQRLAALPHVHVKLSGLTAYARPDQHHTAALAPWVAHVLHCFGPGRMLWGGDWPVVETGAGLPRWIGLTRELLAGLSDDERAAIGWRNALRLYRLPIGSGALPWPDDKP